MPEVGVWAEPFLDRRGKPVPDGLTVTVYEPDGTTLAVLYDDQTGTTPLANPLPTGVAEGVAGVDERANGLFYAEPGPYELVVERSGSEVYRSPIAVAVDLIGAGGAVAVLDEGVSVVPVATALDFVGSPVQVTDGGGGVAVITITGSGGPPSGAAGGVLSGTYPNPGFAVDMATQAELDAEAVLARNADNLTSGTVADARIAATIARDSEVTAAIAAALATAVLDGDAAGGVLSGTYPNPGFAVDMATQAELNAAVLLLAPLASPALTGNPTAPTAAPGDSDTSIATTAFVAAAIAAIPPGSSWPLTADVSAAGWDIQNLGELTFDGATDATFNAEADADQWRIPVRNAGGTVIGGIGSDVEFGPGVGMWVGDNNVPGDYDGPMMFIAPDVPGWSGGAFYIQDTGGTNWIGAGNGEFNIRADADPMDIRGTPLSLFGAAGIDGTDAPATVPALADVLVDLGAIASHTIPNPTALIAQTITNGVTTSAPSQDAVFDALALKADAANPVFTGTVTIPDGALAIADTSGLQTALDGKVNDTGDENIAGVKTFTTADSPVVVDEAYGAGWNADMSVPTKNAVYDKIEATDQAIADLLGLKDGTGTQITEGPAGFLTVGRPVDVQRFTASGTWTKPAGAMQVYAILIGGGAGGASGYRNAEGVDRYGGGGGEAGSVLQAWLDPDDLDATEAVTVGAGGGGGAALSSNGVGNSGTSGGATILDTIAGELTTGTAAGGNHAAGLAPGAGGGLVTRRVSVGGTALIAVPSPSINIYLLAGGTNGSGGAGISRNASNTNIGGNNPGGSTSAAAGGTNGGAGVDAPSGIGMLGGGGAGGTTGGTSGAATGGAGGIPGGGGGGGSFGNAGIPANSGAGGAGARGEAIIITIC